MKNLKGTYFFTRTFKKLIVKKLFLELIYKPDQFVVNLEMDSLSILLIFLIAYGCSDEDPIVPLDERIKSYLDQDPTTKNLLTKIITQEGFMTPQLQTMLHLSLNNLLLSNQIYASTDPNTSVNLPQIGDSIQLENEGLLTALNSAEDQKQYIEEYLTQTEQIASLVNSKYDTSFEGGFIANYNKSEPLSSVLKLTDIQPPLRTHTVNTLIHQFLGVLELSGAETMSLYPEDEIGFFHSILEHFVKNLWQYR